jgi:hypothetical protein
MKEPYFPSPAQTNQPRMTEQTAHTYPWAVQPDAERWIAKAARSPGDVAACLVGSVALRSTARKIGRVVCEPHATVIAAGLVATLAEQQDLPAVAPDIAYLTGDEARSSAAIVAYEVDACLPFDLRRVKAALRQRRWGRPEIKRRGIAELHPESLRKRLCVNRDECGVLLLMPHDGQVVAVLVIRYAGNSVKR